MLFLNLIVVVLCLLVPLAHAEPMFSAVASRTDLAMVNRIAWGLDAADAEQLRQSGFDVWLEQQLSPPQTDNLPERVRQHIAALSISRGNLADRLAERRALQQQLHATIDPDQQAVLKQAINRQNQTYVQEAIERRIVRAIYSRQQLREVLTWFWFNHFNVFAHKGQEPVLLADYEDQAIRPHVLGHFRDLVWASLTHPAMSVYLDNQQNAVNAGNENYARELMELHTLGVNGGYTQVDVQALANILTGADFRPQNNCPPAQHILPDVPEQDVNPLFCFDVRRHDERAKSFLGQTFLAQGGQAEMVRAVDALINSPATAQHVSFQLAEYFLGEVPPSGLVRNMARTFQQSYGDIAKTLRILFHSPEFRQRANAGNAFKDPVRYVLSSLRLFYGEEPIDNVRPVSGWIQQLGEGFYEHVSPEGYALTGQDWLSADQVTKRVEIARQIALAAGVLYTDETVTQQLEQTDKPRLQALRQQERADHPLDSFGVYAVWSPLLSEQTRAVLRRSSSLDEWNSLLLASPEMMRE